MAGSSLIGNLAVLLSMDTSAFERGATHAQRLMARTQRQFQQLGSRIRNIGLGMTAGITAPFAALMRTAIPAAIESRDALGQVEAALRSMGPAAGRTTVQLQRAAGALQTISLFDDDDILRKVTANMLTFGNVAGRQFDRAQLAVVNMATRLGQDLQPATIMVGRALNDPIRGLTALRRVGVAFTAEQERMIRGFVQTGNLAAAQAVILNELEREFGGAAEAARAARPDAAMQQAWREFQETIGAIALRILPVLTDWLTRLLERFTSLSPRMQTFLVGAVAVAAALGPLMIVFGGLVSLTGTLLPLLVRLAPLLTGLGTSAAGATPLLAAMGGPIALGAIAAAALAAVVTFRKWDEISTLVANASTRIRDNSQAMRDHEQAVRGAQGMWDQFASSEAFERHFWQQLEDNIVGIGRKFADLQRDLDAFQAWIDRTDARIAEFARNVGQWFESMRDRAVAATMGLVLGVSRWLQDRLNSVWEGVRSRITAVGNWFQGLYDRVVGHSYIPDMVDEIGRHMRRLDAELVQPATDATAAAAERFQALSTLLDRLFPENRRRIQLETDVSEIRSSGLSPVQQSNALRRLFLQSGALDNVVPLDAGAVGNLADAFVDMGDRASSAFESARSAAGELGRTINDSIIHGLQGMMRGFGSLKSIALNVLYSIGDALIQNLFPKGAGGTGGIGGAIASLITSIIPRRAMGGPVTAGTGYLVGERGPEWFTPSRSGSIVPNHKMGGGGDIHVHVNAQYTGNLATKEDAVRLGSMIAPIALRAVKDARRRGSL